MVDYRICPACHASLAGGEYFCPHCGRALKTQPLSIGWGHQFFYYLVSILLPPLGLWWAYKYWQQNDQVPRRVAIVIVILTAISLIINIWAFVGIYNSLSQAIGGPLQLYNQGL